MNKHYTKVVAEFDMQDGEIYIECYDAQNYLTRRDKLLIVLAPMYVEEWIVKQLLLGYYRLATDS